MTKKKMALIGMGVFFCGASILLLVFKYHKETCVIVEEVLLSILTAGIVAIPNVLFLSSYEKKKFLQRKARLLAKLEQMLNSFPVVQNVDMMTQEVHDKLETVICGLCELLYEFSEISTDYKVKHTVQFQNMQKDLFRLCALGGLCLDDETLHQTTINKCNHYLDECKTDVALLKTLW